MKNAAVIIGRFNPPTIGHYHLITKVKQFIASKGATYAIDPMPFIIIVDGEKSSRDAETNPLSASERLVLMRKNQDTLACKFVIAGSVIDGFNKIRGMGFEPVLIAGGEDRTSQYIQILKDHNPDIDRIELSLRRTIVDPNNSDGIIDNITPEDINMISASLARAAARSGKFDKFKIITGLADTDAETVFNKIKTRTGEHA